jgi:hypothetical protein
LKTIPGDWYTMQMLKKDIERLRRLDAQEFALEIKQNEEHLNYFKQKAIVK